MPTKRIYFDAQNLSDLLDWLRSRPSGRLLILIGDCPPTLDVTDKLFNIITHDGETDEALSFALWMLIKKAQGELEISTRPLPIENIPEGIVLYD